MIKPMISRAASACSLLLRILLLLSPVFFLDAARSQPADSGRVLIEIIVRSGCRHCAAEKAFLDELRKTHAGVEVRIHDIAGPEGSKLFKSVVMTAKLSWSLPITIVGEDLLQGFDTPDTTGRQIENLLARNRGRPIQGFASLLNAPRSGMTDISDSEQTLYVHVPGLGALNAAAWPLPAIAVVLGFLDGFNPCAMWVLVTFLLVLMQIGSRRRMCTVAGLFIIAEAVMVFTILNLWFRLWIFVGMDRFVTPAIGLLALGGGLFFLYQGWKSLGTEMACRVIDMERRSRIVQRIKNISVGEFGVITAIGVIALAFSVNIIEFACSIGYPQAFTKIIELNRLDFWTAQALIGIYTLFYMADDFLVFGLALWGFGKLQLTQKYSRWTALCGGLLMVILGGLMLFRPETLRMM